MSERGKTQRPSVPGAPAQAAPASQPGLPSGFRGGEVAEAIGPARLDPIRRERDAAGAQIQRSLKAWRSASGPAGAASIPKSSGAPLPSSVRAQMEPKLNADLGHVRVHTGGESGEAAKNFGARAFTVGDDVHFNNGEFRPGTKEGDKLLAHELTHVVQGQRSGVHRKADAGEHPHAGVEVSDPNEPAEKEAEAAEKIGDELHGGAKEQAGGRGAGEHKNPVEKPAPIAAKLDGNKVFRAKTPAPAGDNQLKSPSGKPAKEGEVKLGAAPALQLYGYGGVRKVKGVPVKDMEKALKTITDKEATKQKLTPEEAQKKTQYKAAIDDVNQTKGQDYLIFAGHVGVSLDGGATIYGFTPVAPEGMPKEQVIANLHSHAMTFPGQVKNDKPHFDLATRCATEKGWDTDVVSVTRTVTAASHARAKRKLQELSGMAPGAHGLYYSFPLPDAAEGKFFVDTPGPDGKIVLGEDQANCATFPGKIGIELPEQSGNLRFFMPALKQQAQGH